MMITNYNIIKQMSVSELAEFLEDGMTALIFARNIIE